MWFPSISSRVPKLLNFIEALPARFEVPEKLKNLMAAAPAKIDKMETPPRLKNFVSALSTKATFQGTTSGIVAGLTAIAVSGFFAIEDNCPAAQNEIFSAALISLVTRVALDAVCQNENDLSPWTRSLIPYAIALANRNWILGNSGTELLGNLIGSVVKTEYGVIAIGAGIAAKAIAESPLDDLLQLDDAKKSKADKADKTDKKEEKTESKKTSKKKSFVIPANLMNQLLTMTPDQAKLFMNVMQPAEARKPAHKASEEKKRSFTEPQRENPLASTRHHRGYSEEFKVEKPEHPFSSNRHFRGYVAEEPVERKDEQKSLFDRSGTFI